MLFQSRRSATVRTLKFCETVYLHRQDYLIVARHFPDYAKKVRKSAIKVMWTNMLTSQTLKDALLRASRSMDDERARQEVSVRDLTEQMSDIMGALSSRLLDMENAELLKRKERKIEDEKNSKLATDKFNKLKNENIALKQQLEQYSNLN